MLRHALAAVICGLSLAASGTVEASQIIDTALGPVEVEAPERVAVYDIAALDTLVELGVPVVGVPDNLYLDHLVGALPEAEVVGTLFEPDLEALNEVAPDLVIVGTRSSAIADATRRVAPTIDMTIDDADLLADARRRIVSYGTLFGRMEAATRLVEEIDRAVDRAAKAASDKGDALIVMTNGPKISVYGANSRFGWIHRELGVPEAAPGLASAAHGEAVSFEFIAETIPDWLIILDRADAIGSGEHNARATLDNALVARTTAWSKGQVIFLPAAEAYVAAGGARAMIETLDALADAFGAAAPRESGPAPAQ